jgi:hypothetical protein
MYLRDLDTSQHGVAAIRMSDMTVMGGFACAPIASLVHSLSIVMAGLVPASTHFPLPCRQHVDARDKQGYDGGEATR